LAGVDSRKFAPDLALRNGFSSTFFSGQAIRPYRQMQSIRVIKTAGKFVMREDLYFSVKTSLKSIVKWIKFCDNSP